jgi:hypothetical protein
MTELAEVFEQYGPQYRAQFGDKMLPSHRQAMRDIERCRTPALGGHIYTCEACGETQYLYHSCRNRHCPKCQNDKAQLWLEKQQAMLLPVPYFLLTFTLPSELRQVARSHQRLVYGLLFRTSADAVQYLAQDERFVGAQMGMVGVLHTWGRNLSYHPHVHYLVPGGGVTGNDTWKRSRSNFLLPVKALSRIVRAKFRDALRQADPNCFADVPAAVWHKEWVVHCQPVGYGQHALKYLAPYIFRVAIGNNRILKLADDKVTFRYRLTDTGKLKRCTLPAQEFIRRFLQHVLPRGFVKVRYYGFLSSGLRARLAALRQHLASLAASSSSPQVVDAEDGQIAQGQVTLPSPHSLVSCPSCGQAMRRGPILRPNEHAPPERC